MTNEAFASLAEAADYCPLPGQESLPQNKFTHIRRVWLVGDILRRCWKTTTNAGLYGKNC